mmetsp:Transcript_13315/g.41957  ORF Transcript_13315/g.41957 Transcript_13315/m.41957 type:complete len:502 (-) Transcript_13315:35-1540(-)
MSELRSVYRQLLRACQSPYAMSKGLSPLLSQQVRDGFRKDAAQPDGLARAREALERLEAMGASNCFVSDAVAAAERSSASVHPVVEPATLAGKLLGATHITTDDADFFVLARAKSMDAAGRDKAIAELRASLASANTMADIVSYVNNEAALKLVEWRAQSGSSLSLDQISEALRGSAGSGGVYNVELAIQRMSSEMEEAAAEAAVAVNAAESEERDYDAYLQLKRASMGGKRDDMANVAPDVAAAEPTTLTPEAMFLMQRERLLGRTLAPEAAAAAAPATATAPPEQPAAEPPVAVNADNMYAQIRLQQVRDRLATAGAVPDSDVSQDSDGADHAAAPTPATPDTDNDALLLSRYQARLLQRDVVAEGGAASGEASAVVDETMVPVSEAELSAEERYTNMRMQNVREKLGLPPAPLLKKKVPAMAADASEDVGNRLCWVCGERGTHLARGCPQRYDRKHPEAADTRTYRETAAPTTSFEPTSGMTEQSTSVKVTTSQKWVS